MRKLFCLFLFVGTLTSGFGQYAGQASTNMSAGGGEGASGAIYDLMGPISERNKKNENMYSDYQGSPYITDTFLPTTMYYGDENMGNIFYRYNALNEEIEIKKANIEEATIQSLARDKKISIITGGKKMSFKTFTTSKKKTLNGYLTTIIDGKTYDLYKRNYVKFTEGKPAPNSFVKAVPSRFTQFTEYYFQKEGVNRMDEIKLKNSHLIKLMDGNEKSELKQYLKENELNIKNEADLIKVFDYLNS
ncbi:hypothetical protein Q2T41_13060 [Maribacter confluentis]|uniref:Uncharacterized protein n=1 Tax=Maribacter confluentis TaxID=1656093 RepID=A0ABT8RRX0_9FLAO|nr:hypothetical protein [Maribacter confluentis]MDO1513585.1 hypothetical protein [Maribacter confluentis]